MLRDHLVSAELSVAWLQAVGWVQVCTVGLSDPLDLCDKTRYTMWAALATSLTSASYSLPLKGEAGLFSGVLWGV